MIESDWKMKNKITKMKSVSRLYRNPFSWSIGKANGTD